ncbi:hypothetical protein [Pseudomonas sp. KNUC1026]|nr:hypothetical protein [Pseudomonas sp. KNUC1026]
MRHRIPYTSIAIGAVMDDRDLSGPKSQSDIDDFATFWSLATSP